MPTFNPNLNSEERSKVNFEKCLTYVKRTFPNEPSHIQYKMAEGVFAISETFFDLIIPSIVHQTMKPSLN